jgi:SAM-dependent methyltransferase
MHPELERLQRDYGWQPEAVATPDSDANLWLTPQSLVSTTAYSDAKWEEMDALLDDSWWYHTRNLIIQRALMSCAVEGPIWDVGGGSGVVARFLNDQGITALGVEPTRAGALLAARRGVTSFCCSLDDLNLPDNSISAIAMFDVLEHIQRRDDVLREICRVLQPAGYLILTLPALQMLWSQFDVDGGHFLRYNRRTIRLELEENGFVIRRLGYFFALTVLPLVLLRAIPYRLGRRKSIGTETSLAASGGFIGTIAGWIERRVAMRSPFGSSLLVVAQKPIE